MATEPITKELREYVGAVRAYHLTDIHGKKREYVDTTTSELLQIADRIDAEHERLMDDCRRVSTRSVIDYLRGVLSDCARNIECARMREGVVRCRDCTYARRVEDRFVCMVRPSVAHLVDADEHCSWGVRAEDEPPMSEAAKRVFDRLMDLSGRGVDG